MSDSVYDDLGHLLVLQDHGPFGTWWCHIHEDQALECALTEEGGR